MSPTRRAAVLVAGALLVCLGVALVAVRVIDDPAPDPAAADRGAVADVEDASPPFRGLSAGTIRVGDRKVRVVVADSVDERVQGLRGRSDAAPYAGMLFVFGGDSTAAFTMAGVPEPLDIAFFDGSGRRVDELRMEPCQGTDATCPVYTASGPYRYSLETAPGEMPSGRLRVPAG